MCILSFFYINANYLHFYIVPVFINHPGGYDNGQGASRILVTFNRTDGCSDIWAVAILHLSILCRPKGKTRKRERKYEKEERKLREEMEREARQYEEGQERERRRHVKEQEHEKDS